MTRPPDRPDRSPRPHRAARTRRWSSRRWQLGVPLVAAVAGLLFVSSAVSSLGTDLRAGNTDLGTLVQERADEVAAMRAEVDAVQAEVDRLGATIADEEVRELRRRVAAAGERAGLTPVSGPGVVVTLDDSRLDPAPDDIDPNVLIVHQQDLQAFVNALWAGGAVGVALQGQRLVSTTGIKCVGNTVVLEGVPYAPPYRIQAVGDPDELLEELAAAPAVDLYRQYVDAYDLGLGIEPVGLLDLPGYDGQPSMEYATSL